MREWTCEERYKVLKSPKEIKDLHTKIKSSEYRQKFHVQPVTGLSSDPNGFIFDGKKWHLFYQWCPWGAVHGLKYWYHVSSEDLINWKNEGIGIKPDTIYENKGVHSGSAFLINGQTYLFYTGNHRDENWIRTPFTCGAKLTENGVEKLKKPLFGPRPEYTEHQRDPKVLYNKEKDTYIILIGAQRQNKTGAILVYESKDPLKDWQFKGELKIKGFDNFAGMYECPTIEKIGEKDILIFSPQYIKLDGRGNSTNHSIYLIGSLDLDNLTFIPDNDYNFLDYGFDFYAAQLASNINDPNKAIAIAWIGLPDNHYVTESEDWEGSMTLPRELTIKNNILYQNPIEAIKNLREKELSDSGNIESPCEFIIKIIGKQFKMNLFTNGESKGFEINYNFDKDKLIISKVGMTQHFNQIIGETLEVPLKSKLENLRIFVDKSSIEIFINNGEETFTSHIFPISKENHYKIQGEYGVKIYKLKESVKDDFVI